MKKILLVVFSCLLWNNLICSENVTSCKSMPSSAHTVLLDDIKPSYLDDAVIGGIDSNWFLFVRGGFSAFAGNPLGCGDFYDRINPMLNIGFGKWITPKFGLRASFQGFKFQECGETSTDRFKREYQNYHADIFLNVSEFFRSGLVELPKWDLAPYVGLGLIRNGYNHNKPFAFSYGVFLRYRVSHRLHLSAEIGSTTTFRDFDGKGDKDKFGDNLLQGSIGLDITIGKAGWKRITDARPYIKRNDDLVTYLKGDTHSSTSNFDEPNSFQRTNYSGLESLKQRMYGVGPDEVVSSKPTQIVEKSSIIGSPVYFFFRKNTYRLIDKAQMVNLRKMAKIIIHNDLKVRIIGAADDYSGTDRRNNTLSKQRAGYIALLLHKRGVKVSCISREIRGGIKYYSPIHANRFARVELYR